MTDPLIDELVNSLQQVLGEPTRNDDDFVRLASAGEPLRRALAYFEEAREAKPVADAYEAALKTYQGPIPSSLAADANSVAAELVAYSELPLDQREPTEALSLMLELDAIMSTIVAAERTGHLPEGTADQVSAQLEDELMDVSDRSSELAQYAEDRWLLLGNDPDLPGAYGWLDTLAAAAPSRANARDAVRSAANREKQIARAMEILDRPRPSDRIKSTYRQIPPQFMLPNFAAQAHFSTTENTMPEHVVLAESEDLHLFVETTSKAAQLVVAFSPPLLIDAVEASVDGSSLPPAPGGDHEFRFDLPTSGSRLRVEVRIGDERVAHELELRRA